jgi:CheY-like chemotaxis protein
MSGRHILVVEDERIVAADMISELERFGYEVSGVASTADEAVARAVRDRPDLVLMDVHLKGGRDGVAAAREIRDRCGTPVVYLSAFDDPETVARAAETAPYGYLLKPYEERELHTTIETALAKHRAEQRLAESERWLAGTLAGIDDAVIAADPGNQVHLVNLAAESLTGCRAGEAVGLPLAAVCALVSTAGAVALEDLADRAVCESREVVLPAGTDVVARNGRKTPVEGSLCPIYDPGGQFLGTALTLRPARRSTKPNGRQPAILVAEAEPAVREFGRRALQGCGYQVFVAEDGPQAVELFRQAPVRIDLAVIDLNLPRLGGDAVLARLLEFDPDVEVIFASDYFAEDRCEGGHHLAGVVSKPYSRDGLVLAVERALARRAAAAALGGARDGTQPADPGASSQLNGPGPPGPPPDAPARG